MTSSEHMARCRAMRGGVTESEASIIADLAAKEEELEAAQESTFIEGAELGFDFAESGPHMNLPKDWAAREYGRRKGKTPRSAEEKA